MKLDIAYRACVVALLIGQLLWFLFPWASLYGEQSVAALLFYGADSILGEQALNVASHFIFALYLVTYAGMYFFMRWARNFLLVLLLLGGLWIPVNGIAVQSGYEAMLGYFLTLGDGFLIGISFFSRVSQGFSRS
ncbi:hypothetical protein [Luteimonas wenzhouensis]|uniref:DUF4345 domain-containing protein n=1 Tax=Luteimonas wenzhouensis TaxID=2599615 RepID=A0A5C5TVS8_9GAMM|nr:hypothetical protein [Luteimonas wenzhouensis]TWT18313.1 hypothetical protein FQY79_10510 [Luteimonas wenzhouensis]